MTASIWTPETPVLSADVLAAFAAPSGSSLVGHIASGAGAVTRTVQAKLREWVSVKDFGALGDGSDDTAAFIKLSNYIKGAFTIDDGRPVVGVYFPPGEYTYSGGLEFDAPVILFANGDATLNYTGTGNFIRLGPKNLLNSPTAFYYEEVSVVGLRFTGGVSATHGIYISDSVFEPRIKGCTFIDIGNAGFYCIFGQANNWNALVEDCRLFTLNTNRAANFVWFKGISENGVSDGSNSRVTVRDCFMTSYNSTAMGDFVRLNSAKCRVVGGGHQWSTRGIVLEQLANAVTVDTVYAEIYVPGGAFITPLSLIEGSNFSPQDVTVRNCYVNLHNSDIGNTGRLVKAGDANVLVRGWTLEDIVYADFANAQTLVQLNNVSGQDKNSYRNVRPLFVPRSGATTDIGAFPPSLGSNEHWSSFDAQVGTWTPSVGGTATYTSRSGFYTRVGNQVTCTFDVLINVIGTGSTSLIGGLPFPAASTCAGTIGFFSSLAIAVTALMPRIDAASSDITLTGTTAAGVTTAGTLAVLGNGARVIGTITYTI
jgi:hypothetical protein